MYGLTVITPPSSEPVLTVEAKAHLRIDHDAEDGLITGWIKAARELSEAYTGRRWVTQELLLTLPGWPTGRVAGWDGAIALPVEPVASVDSITYFDQGGTEQELAGYQTWLDHGPPLVLPAPQEHWPALQIGRLKPIAIEFTAGTGAENVPEAVRAAILLCLGQWDQERAGGRPADLAPNRLPPAAAALLDSLWNGAYR